MLASRGLFVVSMRLQCSGIFLCVLIAGLIVAFSLLPGVSKQENRGPRNPSSPVSGLLVSVY